MTDQSNSPKSYELVVIGAGPAGLAAASLAARRGAATILIDEQQSPGGQIFRAVEKMKVAESILGSEYQRGHLLAQDFRTSGAEYRPGTTVWQLAPISAQAAVPNLSSALSQGSSLSSGHQAEAVDLRIEVGLSGGGQAEIICANQVIIASGALERPMPIPGWTLPGVLSVGAAQTMLKAEGLAFQDSVIAGTGPLLYLVAAQYVRAGMPPRMVLDTTPQGNRLRALRHWSLVLERWADVRKGMRWINEIKRAGVQIVRGVKDLVARGDDQLRSVTYTGWRCRGTVEISHLLLHQGVVPNTALSMAAGCDHKWDEGQLCWRPVLDDWLETSISGLRVAGDGGGIEGGEAAEHQGRLAALAALVDLSRISEGERNTLCTAHLRAVVAARRFRPFLDDLFRPPDSFRIPQDPDTIVCRCEEISAKQIRDCVQLGCQGPNQLKSFCRAGMGPCQGRMCGLTVSEIIAVERNMPVGRVGHYRLRPPVKPVTLGELAAIADAEGMSVENVEAQEPDR